MLHILIPLVLVILVNEAFDASDIIDRSYEKGQKELQNIHTQKVHQHLYAAKKI